MYASIKKMIANAWRKHSISDAPSQGKVIGYVRFGYARFT
jgi:hypothetical protein